MENVLLLPVGIYSLLWFTIYVIMCPEELFNSLAFRYCDAIVDYLASVVLWVFVFGTTFALIKLCERILRWALLLLPTYL
jgi:hypothetical protein